MEIERGGGKWRSRGPRGGGKWRSRGPRKEEVNGDLEEEGSGERR